MPGHTLRAANVNGFEWRRSVQHELAGAPDGAVPYGVPLPSQGTVYTAGTLSTPLVTILHSFNTSGQDRCRPDDAHGILYGVTAAAAVSGRGVVFAVNP